ncbi:2591_t:CDS:2, partial [Scutellospora calospora]
MSQETHNDLDITSNSGDMTLAVEASKDINFEDDAIVIDNEDIDFNFVDNEDIGFAFDDSSYISFTPDNDENTNVNSDDVDSTIDSSSKDTSVKYSKSVSKRNGHGQRTSIVWEFFSEEKNEDQEVVAIVCNICKKKWKPGNTTGTFAIHLNNKHHRNISLKQQTLLRFATTPYTPKEAKRTNEITKSIVDFIVCYQLPFTVVDNKYFRKMVSVLDPRYRVLCRQILSNEIMSQFENTHEKIINLLENVSSIVSVTCDIWTAISNQAYLGITIHYIDDNWELRSFLLDLIHYLDHHYGTHTKDLLLTLFNKFKIIQNIMGLTTDNDASMIVAGRELQVALSSLENNNFVHCRCAAHILNIAVKHGMQLETIIIEKVRNFIKKVRHSQLLCDSLRNICAIQEVEYLKPELDIETRWNSTFLMLQKFNRMSEILEFLVAKNKKQLEDSWLDESDSYPAISDIRLVFIGLQRHLDQYLSNYEEDECYMAQSIMHKLEEYWNIIEESTILPTLLNPCSKLKTFVTCETRSAA